MKLAAPLIVALALAGCTTVEDFQKMSAPDRAARVCDRDREVQGLRRSKQAYVDAISSAQEALGRGYRVHRACEQVEVPTGSEKTCQTNGTQTVCTERQVMKKEQRCHETPVPINPDNERRNVADWGQAAAGIEQQLQASYARCYHRVLPMTPEQAFQLY